MRNSCLHISGRRSSGGWPEPGRSRPHSLRENEVAAGVGCLVGGRLAVLDLEMIVEPPLAVRADLDQAGPLRRGPDIMLRRKAACQAFAFLEQRKRHVSPPDQKPPTMAMPKAASGSCTGGGTGSSTCQTPTFGNSNTWQFEHLAASRSEAILRIRKARLRLPAALPSVRHEAWRFRHGSAACSDRFADRLWRRGLSCGMDHHHPCEHDDLVALAPRYTYLDC